ncbi:MAG: outer membrane lipoprotein carrier protein LolA [Bacteroidales bacterium]|nr:outer membrane lipoprotein carrier protein LolA [Bacteroidales bacterium]MCF8338081.1 outer membrane lipoprotein carrier protein LolA [Bacteroidales bacterium]
MKNLIILVFNLALLFPGMAFGQQNSSTEILDQVAKKTQSYDAIKIIFNYSMENEGQDIHENYKGEITSKGKKYRLKVAGQIIINNGEKVWTYIPDAKEVQLNEVTENNTRFNPTQLIKNYKKEYKTRFIENVTEKNRELAVIELIPKNNNEEVTFKKAHLFIDKTRDEIYRLKVFGEMRNEFTYTVKELLPNISVQENTFHFNKENHPDVDVIDMR